MNAQLARFLQVAHSQEGYRSGRNLYNKYGVWMGNAYMNYCAAFVSWVASTAGVGALVGKTSAAHIFMAAFKAKGRWGSSPRIGALVIYDWQPTVREAVESDHIGIVYGFDASYIYTIEGNTGSPNGVWRVKRPRNNYIMGYCYPSFTDPVPAAPQGPPPWHRPGYVPFTIKAPNTYACYDARQVEAERCPVLQPWARDAVIGGWVTYLGGKLLGSSHANGYFGPELIAAVKKLQKAHGYPPTGVVRAHEWNSLGQRWRANL